jgi:hypothetical protein
VNTQNESVNELYYLTAGSRDGIKFAPGNAWEAGDPHLLLPRADVADETPSNTVTFQSPGAKC